MPDPEKIIIPCITIVILTMLLVINDCQNKNRDACLELTKASPPEQRAMVMQNCPVYLR